MAEPSAGDSAGNWRAVRLGLNGRRHELTGVAAGSTRARRGPARPRCCAAASGSRTSRSAWTR